ncbi:hypothetical protein ABC977_15385 [Thioalkalicoccus limnaeus]|uniref:Uncharacterized protein n=1 Tax=Thioalkalicoccus limnaeus TaxID=120681 RepID=A0ABV4BGY2_9GAMM
MNSRNNPTFRARLWATLERFVDEVPYGTRRYRWRLLQEQARESAIRQRERTKPTR